MAKNEIIKTAIVNTNAVDTWLEPYIGHEVNISKVGKSHVFVSVDYGYGIEDIEADKEYFDL